MDRRKGEEVVEKCEYFHGFIVKQELKSMLRKNGDFVVREGNTRSGVEILISVRWGGSIRDVVVVFDERGRFRTEKTCDFTTVQQLIAHYWSTGRAVVPSGIQLKIPIGREPWEKTDGDIDWEGSLKLGSGAFGLVHKAKMRGGEEVAVKTCEEEGGKVAFLHESRMMREARHPFVVSLIGVCSLEPPIKILLELVDGGDLYGYLRDKRNDPTKIQMTKFALDSVTGFEYLASKNILHLDVATRNCLLKSEEGKPKGEWKAIIADFGLSQFGPEYRIQAGDPISLRWAPPELLGSNAVATIKSDVWSFGVLVWEIYTRAKTPYAHIADTNNILFHLEEGHRETMPQICPKPITELVIDTWKWDGAERPTFRTLRQHILPIYQALLTNK